MLSSYDPMSNTHKQMEDFLIAVPFFSQQASQSRPPCAVACLDGNFLSRRMRIRSTFLNCDVIRDALNWSFLSSLEVSDVECFSRDFLE